MSQGNRAGHAKSHQFEYEADLQAMALLFGRQGYNWEEDELNLAAFQAAVAGMLALTMVGQVVRKAHKDTNTHPSTYKRFCLILDYILKRADNENDKTKRRLGSMIGNMFGFQKMLSHITGRGLGSTTIGCCSA